MLILMSRGWGAIALVTCSNPSVSKQTLPQPVAITQVVPTDFS